MGITGGVLGLVDFIPSTTKMLIVIKHSPGYCLALSSLFQLSIVELFWGSPRIFMKIED